jgi:hypothetical protein
MRRKKTERKGENYKKKKKKNELTPSNVTHMLCFIIFFIIASFNSQSTAMTIDRCRDFNNLYY